MTGLQKFMKKILIINDGRKTTNWGLQASSQALITVLTSKKHQITTLSHKLLHQAYTISPEIFGKNLFSSESRLQKKVSPQFIKIPFTADQYEYYEEQWIKGKGGTYSKIIMNQIEENDIILFNAEGSTYRKNFGSLAGLFLLYLSSKRFGKRSYFTNGSVSITSVDNVLEGIINKVYKADVKFSVREPYSYRNLINIGVHSEIVPDSVFYYAEESKVSKISKYFSVSKSMLPMLIDKKNKVNDPFINLIVRISEETDLSPILLSRDPEDEVILTIKKYIKDSRVCTGKNINFKEVQKIISDSNFLISGRYHHLIFGANTYTPLCFMGSSSHKVHGLSELLTGSDHETVYDPTNIKLISDQIINQCINSQSIRWNPMDLKKKFINYVNHEILN